MLDKIKNSFWTLQIGGWLVYFVVIYITFLSIAAEGNFLRLLYIKGFRTIVGFILSLILWRFYRRIIHRYPPAALIAVVLGTTVVFGILWTAIELLFGYLNWPATFNFYDTLPRTPRIALDYAMTLTAWSAIYFGIKYWQSWQAESRAALENSALAQKAQLEMLRYQLNPHFLFNALNSIRASVDEDKDRATGMITQLSEFLRYSLLNESAKMVTLSEELEALRNYLAIEKIRFEDKICVTFHTDEAADHVEVPCFLLNPLVENAIKHGMRSGVRPLAIGIRTSLENRRLNIEVTNTGGMQPASNGTGIGLKNVRERLENLYNGEAKLVLGEEDGAVNARIEIPV